MITDPLTGLAVIVVVAALCQLLASRLDVPSVLFLLVAGIGVSGVLDPDELFGELMFTAVGIGVAILLFEGGTSLHWSRLQTGRGPVVRLVTIGAAISWAIGAGVAALVLDVPLELAILVGAILIVSGPTVVIPLLRVVRPRQPTSSILRWEGILIDPIGAGLAIVVLDAIIEERSLSRSLLRVVTTFAAGAVVGAVVSVVLVQGLRHRLIADHLQIPATLAALIGAYAASNAIRPEAGLIAATILGMAFANQSRAPAAHIAEFNEDLGSVVLGVLFVVLGARIELSEIVDNLVPSLIIIAVLVLVARPIAVIASTIGSRLGWRDRAFLMVLAPRGVVAAAVASLFALELSHHDVDPGPLVPVVFTVVIGTVLLTGVAARFAAAQLRVAQPPPRGVALVGGGAFGIELAELLHRLQVPTIHIGLDEQDAALAADRGQLVYQGRLDSDDLTEAVRAVGVASVLALSGTDHLDGFVTERLSRVVGSANLYGLAGPAGEPEPGTSQLVVLKPVFPPELHADDLQHPARGPGRLRLSPADRPRPADRWLTLGRIDEDGAVVFDPDPAAASETDRLIQFETPLVEGRT